MALTKEFQYYIDHQKDLVKKYEGKFVVIKDDEVLGVYNSEIEAYTETQKTHKLGTFLIQQCLPGEGGRSQTFHSRVTLTR